MVSLSLTSRLNDGVIHLPMRMFHLVDLSESLCLCATVPSLDQFL